MPLILADLRSERYYGPGSLHASGANSGCAVRSAGGFWLTYSLIVHSVSAELLAKLAQNPPS